MSAPLSARNPRLKNVRRLARSSGARHAEKQYVVEGLTLVLEAEAAGVALGTVYCEADCEAQVRAAVRSPVQVVANGAVTSMASTRSPQGVIADAAMHDVTLEQAGVHDLVLVCVDVADPGNLGTVMRSAEAAGAGAVICCGDGADVFNPKVVRASAGALFWLDIVNEGDPPQVLDTLASMGLRRIGTSADAQTSYDAVDLTFPSAIVVGNEARGLPRPLSDHLDTVVSVPIAGHAESLNVAMAATIVCFEAARQRRHG